MAAQAWGGRAWGPGLPPLGLVVPQPQASGRLCLSSALCGFLECMSAISSSCSVLLTGLRLQAWGSHWDGADR